MVNIPFYKLKDGLWIEAHIIGKVDELTKVALVKGDVKCVSRSPQSGWPQAIEYDRLRAIIRESYERVLRMIEEVEESLRSRYNRREYVLVTLYNPGQYMGSIAGLTARLTTLKMVNRLYERLLSIMPDKPMDLCWASIDVKDDEVYLNGVKDDQLTKLYVDNDSFREALTSLISSRSLAGSAS